MTEQAMSPLRRRMIEDRTIRKLAQLAQNRESSAGKSMPWSKSRHYIFCKVVARSRFSGAKRIS